MNRHFVVRIHDADDHVLLAAQQLSGDAGSFQRRNLADKLSQRCMRVRERTAVEWEVNQDTNQWKKLAQYKI